MHLPALKQVQAKDGSTGTSDIDKEFGGSYFNDFTEGSNIAGLINNQSKSNSNPVNNSSSLSSSNKDAQAADTGS